jgi:MFS family permease
MQPVNASVNEPVERPTRVRHAVIATSVAMAFILYLDRICLGEIVKSESFRADMPLTREQIGTVLGSFFLAYAICQVPAGWASDRFGARRMLTIYIAGWSLMTAATGLAGGMWGLLLARLGCGIFEAGAYPASGGIVRRWAPLAQRARASSLVAFGGRIGGALAPLLTAWMIVACGDWRPVLWIDGLVGLAIAAVYWWVVRDLPMEHPRCNDAELALLPSTAEERPPSARMLAAVIGAACRNRTVWLKCLASVAVNVGWTFLVTWLPTYLADVWQVGAIEGGRMVTFVLAWGMAGMLAGGVLCDWTTRRFGRRWGRLLPIFTGHMLAGTAYLACPAMPTAWGVVACCSFVSFGTDLCNASGWALWQDIGGRNVGTLGGWGNMWGNFGASLSAKFLPLVMVHFDANQDWQEVFLACAACYGVAFVATLAMDPLTRVDAVHESEVKPRPA